MVIATLTSLWVYTTTNKLTMDGTDDFFTGGPVEQQGGVGVGVGVPVDGAASAEGGGAPEGSFQDLGGGDYGGNADYGNGDFNAGGAYEQQQPNGDGQSNGFDPGVGGFAQGYASLDNDAMGGGVGNGMGDGMGNLPDMGMPAPEDVEPSALDDFMERWQATLAEKASIEAEAKSAALDAAKADLETHGLERAAKKEAKMGRNREEEQVFLEQLEGELESENPWERVVSLVDTQAEIVEDFKDKSRMTSILIQLKNDPLDTSSTAAAS